MKLKIQHISIVFALVGATLSSCIKTIEYKGEEGESVLVVNEIVEKDSTFIVDIEHSVFFLDANTGDNSLSDVQVSIKNTTTSAEEVQTSGPFGEYEFNMIAEEGHTYEITASHPDYPSVSAVTTIPVTVPLVSVDTNGVQESEFERVMHSTLTWNDPPGANYYIVYCHELNSFGGFQHSLTSKDPAITNVQADFDSGEKYGNFFALDDASFEGGQKSLDIEFNVQTSGPPYQLEYTLVSCSEDAYKYIISSDLNLNAGDGPFTEPVRVRNNIENGLGIFAGISNSVIVK